MVVERLPERVRTPAVARAVTSPGAVLLAGAGMSVAVLAGAAWPVAAAAGAVAWLARVALAVPRRPAGDRPDPFAVGEPWRTFVQDALQAQRRFGHTVNRMKAGPLRERLTELGQRIDHGVRTCWRIAQQGDALDGAVKEIDPDGVARELADAEGPTAAALQSQLATADRLARVSRDAHERLRVLNAQLDEVVVRAIELSVGTADVAEVGSLSTDVESLVGEMESLRVALQETA